MTLTGKNIYWLYFCSENLWSYPPSSLVLVLQEGGDPQEAVVGWDCLRHLRPLSVACLPPLCPLAEVVAVAAPFSSNGSLLRHRLLFSRTSNSYRR